MILAIPTPVRFFCESPSCRAALLALTVDGQPVAQAWRMPITARCAGCGLELYLRKVEGQ